MEWQKSPETLVQTFTAALPDDPRIERRKVFGYPCAFVGGNMFAGLHAASLMVRLPEEAREKLLAEPGASIFEHMPGRPMREYVVVPPQLIAEPQTLSEWLHRAFQYGTTLPPKIKEKRASGSLKRRASGSRPAKRP